MFSNHYSMLPNIPPIHCNNLLTLQINWGGKAITFILSGPQGKYQD